MLLYTISPGEVDVPLELVLVLDCVLVFFFYSFL